MGLACLLATTMAASSALAGTTSSLTNFGSNPKSLPMYLFTPTTVAAKPPLLVALHACHAQDGGKSTCAQGSTFGQQAEKYGFLMVCPSAVSSDQCWDVHSTADLTHDGKGSDVEGIMSAVTYVIANKNADANRVYAAGYSSGGMMTQVLLGSYPDVFKAGAAFAGVPFACFAQGSIDSLGWSTTCATGNVTKSGAQWGDLVRAAYPGFTGTRPRIQLWHGSIDTTVAFHNFAEAIKQWTNVLGVSETPTSTEDNALQSGWIRTRYADSAGVVQVEAIQETGKGHGDLTVNGAEAVRFMGLDGSNPVPDAGVAKDSAVPPDSASKTDSAGNTGGSTATGGTRAAGGAGGTGAVTASGGTTGGVLASGGVNVAGGTLMTGGFLSSGGVLSSGGASVTGGALATGGVVRTGGTSSSGGVTQADGSSRTGGAMAAGGSAHAGGSVPSDSSSTSQPTAGNKATAGGCSVARGNANRSAPASLLLVLGIVIATGRWRARK